MGEGVPTTTTTEGATAQGSNSFTCLPVRLSLLVLWTIPGPPNDNNHYSQSLLLVKMVTLPREAEHSNVKLFPLVSVLTPLNGKIPFSSH